MCESALSRVIVAGLCQERSRQRNMAAAVLGMAQMAAEAVASREQMRLTQQLREEEMKYRAFEMEWKEKDYRSFSPSLSAIATNST